MAWRDMAERLDRTVVETFDYGDVAFQKMDGDDPAGLPVPLPAEFDGGHVSIQSSDGQSLSTVGKALYIHYGHLPPGTKPEQADRFVIGSGRAAGTYEVDDVEENDDATGAIVRLKRL